MYLKLLESLLIYFLFVIFVYAVGLLLLFKSDTSREFRETQKEIEGAKKNKSLKDIAKRAPLNLKSSLEIVEMKQIRDLAKELLKHKPQIDSNIGEFLDKISRYQVIINIKQISKKHQKELHGLFLIMLNTSETEVKSKVIDLLVPISLNKKDLIKVLVNTLSDKNGLIRLKVAEILRNIGETNLATEVIIKELNNEDFYIRYNAAMLLGRVDKANEIIKDSLAKTLQDSDPIVSMGAKISLEKIKVKETASNLNEVTTNKDNSHKPINNSHLIKNKNRRYQK